MFLINMMTLKEEILEAEAVPPPLGKESRKFLGNSSNVCYRRVSTKAKASTVYCFLWEPGKQNRKKKLSVRIDPGEENNYLQSSVTCPALLDVRVTSRVLANSNAKMGTTCYFMQAEGRTGPQDRQTLAFLLGYEWYCSHIS